MLRVKDIMKEHKRLLEKTTFGAWDIYHELENYIADKQRNKHHIKKYWYLLIISMISSLLGSALDLNIESIRTFVILSFVSLGLFFVMVAVEKYVKGE